MVFQDQGPDFPNITHRSLLPSIAASSQWGMFLIIKPPTELPCNLDLFHSLLLAINPDLLVILGPKD